MDTFSYKNIGDLSIECDVYEPDTILNGSAILWLHGGGLIGGSRKWIPPYQLKMYLEAGYTVVAADYRLLPETKLPGIVEDVNDAFQWIPDNVAGIKNTCVVGHSGGGYLALYLGTKIGIRPKAIVSFYGYGEIAAEWYTTPSDYYLESAQITEEEAYSLVGTEELADAADHLERFTFYTYCRQHGIWPIEAMGLDPKINIEQFLSYSPTANVDDKCPPTLLIHAKDDWDVPHEQSANFNEAMKLSGNTCKFLTIDDGGHMFDSLYEGDPPNSGINASKEAIKFLNEYLA